MPTTAASASTGRASIGHGGAIAPPVTRRRPAWLHGAVLTAVGALVVLVSLPRLRGFALHDNQGDARHMLRLLAADVFAGAVFAGGASAGEPTGPADLGALLAADPSLARRLSDTEVLARGRLLRRHGYLFELVRAADGPAALRAWPWRHGRTGLAAYVLEGGGELVELANADARYSGLASPPGVALASEH